MRVIAALLLMTSAGVAGELEIAYENFQVTRTGAAELVIKFTNHTDRHIDYAAARCALLDDNDRAITTMSVIASSVPAGGIAYAKNYGPRDSRIKHAACRVEY